MNSAFTGSTMPTMLLFFWLLPLVAATASNCRPGTVRLIKANQVDLFDGATSLFLSS